MQRIGNFQSRVSRWHRAASFLKWPGNNESTFQAFLPRLLASSAINEAILRDAKLADQAQPVLHHQAWLATTTNQDSLKTLRALPQKLAAALQKKKVEKAWKMFHNIRERPEALTRDACNFMLNRCARDRNPEMALEIFKLMEVQQVTPDQVSHSCLLRALSRGGRAEEAVRRLEELVDQWEDGKGFASNLVMFNSVLNGCAYAASQPLADRCLKAMRQVGVAMDSESYSELIKLAGLAGDLGAMERWWGELLRDLQRPCHLAYIARITGLARCGDLATAVEVLHQFCEAVLNGELGLPERKYRGLLNSRGHKYPRQMAAVGRPSKDGESRGPGDVLKHVIGQEPPGKSGAVRVDPPEVEGVAACGSSDPFHRTDCEAGRRGNGQELKGTGNLYGGSAQTEIKVGARMDLGSKFTEDVAEERGSERGLDDGQVASTRIENMAGGLKLQDKEGWWGRGEVASLDEWLQKELMIAYNVVLNAASRKGNYELAKTLVSEMLQAGLELDYYSYNAWMRATAKAAGVDHTLQVWNVMKAAGLEPDRHSHEALLAALCRENRLDEAESLLQEMQAKGKAKRQKWVPSKYAYNGILETCAAQGEPDRAMVIYSSMRNAGVQPDICTFLALLSASGGPRAVGVEGGNWAKGDAASRVEAIQKEMAATGVKPTAAIFSAMVQLLGREGLLEAVRDRLADARGRVDSHGRPLLDAVAFNAAINACAQSGKMDAAMEVFEEMKAVGVRPTVTTFNVLINGCSYASQSTPNMALAFELADAMRSHGFVPDIVTYNSLIKVVCHGSMLEVALQLLGEMEKGGVAPDLVTLHTVMTSANHHKRLDVMEFLLEHMHRRGLAPDSTTCCLAVTAYIEADRLDDAVEALRVLSARMLVTATGPDEHAGNLSAGVVGGLAERLMLNSSRDTRQKGGSDHMRRDQESCRVGGGSPESGADPPQGSLEPSSESRRPEKLEAVDKLMSFYSESKNTAGMGQQRAGMPTRDILESGIGTANREALATFMLKLAAVVDGNEQDARAEMSPWAARLRLLYNRRNKQTQSLTAG